VDFPGVFSELVQGFSQECDIEQVLTKAPLSNNYSRRISGTKAWLLVILDIFK